MTQPSLAVQVMNGYVNRIDLRSLCLEVLDLQIPIGHLEVYLGTYSQT